MPRHLFRLPRWSAAAVLLAMFSALLPVHVPDAEAAAAPTLQFTGHGWGHGRGLSQWGAEGYSRNHAWNYRQILAHYYSNTSVGTATNKTQRVRLMAMDQKSDYNITATAGTRINIHDGDVTDPGTHRYLRVLHDPARNGWRVYSRASTSDPWKFRGASGDSVTVGRHTAGTLSVNGRSYPGSIRAWHRLASGARHYRTMAITRTEAYLRGVVPNESPASWSQPALRAQAVAARSYLLAGDVRHHVGGVKYADTCDTTLCQVYDPNVTHPNTDTAVNATAGEVRRTSSGAIARTEFSSSSGGWTAGGDFPAVRDQGDVISPHHTWSASVSAAPLQNRYAGGSALTTISVTSRNGLGDWGGRALKVRLRFADGTDVTVSGDAIRSLLGLRSNWFIVDMGGGPPVPPPGITSKSLPVSEAARYQPLVGDFDGNGFSDVFWYAPGGAQDHVWWSGPGGTFSWTRTSVYGDYRPLVGDVDGNGIDDILWYGDGGASSVWRGTASRSFNPASLDIPGNRRLFLADIGGDGTEDIVVFGPGAASDHIITWRSGFSTRGISVSGDYRPVVGDFDGNGADDIFWYAPGVASDILWHTFAGDEVIRTDRRVDGDFRPFVGDFDGTGTSDIMWYAPGAVADHTWFGRTASGRFTSQRTSVHGTYRPVVADLGADGRDDIVWYGSGSTLDGWWRFGASRNLTASSLSLPGTYLPTAGTFGSGRDGILWYGPGSSPDSLWYA